MEIKVRAIITKEDYEHNLNRINEIFDETQGELFQELNILCMIVEQYERYHYGTPKSSPLEVIKYMMEQRGLRQKDIAPYVGGKNCASAILRGKRELTLKSARRLSEALSIPLILLI